MSAYGTLKQRSKEFSPRQRNLLNKDGNITLSCLEDILQRWNEYGKPCSKIQSHWTTGQHEPPILESEVEDAIKRLPKNKAAGLDAIPAEFIQSGGDAIAKFTTVLFSAILDTGK